MPNLLKSSQSQIDELTLFGAKCLIFSVIFGTAIYLAGHFFLNDTIRSFCQP